MKCVVVDQRESGLVRSRSTSALNGIVLHRYAVEICRGTSARQCFRADAVHVSLRLQAGLFNMTVGSAAF